MTLPADVPYSPALLWGGPDQCPHGVTDGAALRPEHRTPGCPLCRADYLAAARDLSQHTAPRGRALPGRTPCHVHQAGGGLGRRRSARTARRVRHPRYPTVQRVPGMGKRRAGVFARPKEDDDRP